MEKLLQTIKNIVGDNGLLTGDDVTARPLNWMGLGNRQALAIVRPASTQEVSDVMKTCNTAGQSLIALGGLSGLVGATDSTPHDILLSLERMADIEDIDPLGKTMTVQAGAHLQKVQEAAAAAELQFALDLGARGSCTIGGNIATNAGGNQVLRYGMMREQVLGLEVVLADGTIISSMNTLLKNNTGYDLKHLFIGSEGTLGIVTRAVLRLHPCALSTNTALVAVNSFEMLTGFFALMSEQLAGKLTAFEVMWQDFYQLIAMDSGRHTPPLPADHAYYIVVEQQGAHPEHDSAQFSAALEMAIQKNLLVDAVISQSVAQAQSIWDIREDVQGLTMALMPGLIFDISLPIKHMDNYISNLRTQVSDTWGAAAKMVVFGHLGDGNLHIIISVGDGSEAIFDTIKNMVYQPLQDIGGSVSAEHGIGLEKKDYLALSRSNAEIALMQKIKQTLDPNGILNPQKIFGI
jgi:FAD/FMN-containing dehydrogenase